MRLINTKTGVFEEFIGSRLPKYAILSHTWEEEEVTFKDVAEGKHESKKGFQKIAMTCPLAAQSGIDYAWVGTCCIDKSSSAELTEAINSMYRWYQRAEICYAYLSDLPSETHPVEKLLKKCRWFTRGWTLQELIAPSDVQFFDKNWHDIGTKMSLADHLSEITGITQSVLQGSESLFSLSVAQKMSWAAKRETTRIEDVAYCLLGIFDVNMPLLYGEEEKAFRRLQEEIIKSTADYSIFAWSLPYSTEMLEKRGTRVLSGVLADSPAAFWGCGAFTAYVNTELRESSISNNGVNTRGHVVLRWEPERRAECYVLPLDCHNEEGWSLGVRLRVVGADQYLREDPWNVLGFDEARARYIPMEGYLLTKLPKSIPQTPSGLVDMNVLIPRMRLHVLQVKLPEGIDIYEPWPSKRFDDEDQLFFVTSDPRLDVAIVRLTARFSFQEEDRTIEEDFGALFCAVGYSHVDSEGLQCTIVDHEAFAKQVNDLQGGSNASGDWEYKRQHVIEQLSYHKIPKSGGVAFRLPRSKFSALVSFTRKLVIDPKICGNRYWLIEFSYEFLKTKKLPELPQQKWDDE